MQWLAKISVLRPTFAAVLILALCVAGVFSYTQLGIDQYPDVDLPTVTVTTKLTGASAEEMDSTVTDQIEKQVNSISGIDNISSVSSEGISTVSITFNLEKNGDVAFQEVQAKVNLAQPSLPTDAKQPTVQKFSADQAAVISFTLTAPNESTRNLTEYADKVLRPKLESVSGVGQAAITGGRLRQINVRIDPYRLRAYGVTAVDVRNGLSSQNVELPGGALEEGKRRITLNTQGRFTSVDALKSLVVAQHDTQSVYLRDVAEVTDDEVAASSIARFNGQSTVLVEVKKQSGGNTVAVIQNIKERLAEIAPTLPAGYKIQIARDQSVFIVAAVDTVKEHLILGSFLAAVVVLLFLWDWRSTLIASLAIPGSIIATFTLMWAKGFTLNTITLLALTLSVGIVIDDAILVLENIYRFIHEKNRPPHEAAIEATQEIGLAVLATTLSLVAIFVPVAFMSGISGRFLSSFGLTMSFAIMVSLLVAFTLTPMLASRWLRRSIRSQRDMRSATQPEIDTIAAESDESASDHEDPPAEADKRGIYHRLEVVYWHLLRWALKHRGWVVALSVGTFLCTIPLLILVDKKFIPEDDQSQFVVAVQTPEGTSLERTADRTEQIAAEIRKITDIQSTLVTVGSDAQGSANSGSILVQMADIGKRKSGKTEFEVMQDVRTGVLSRFPSDLTTSVSATSAFSGGAAMAAIQYIISGPELTTLQSASDRMVAALRALPGVSDVSSSSLGGNPQARLTIHRSEAADLGVSASDLASTVQIAVAGVNVGSYAEGGRLYDINVRALPEYRRNAEGLSLFTVPSTKSGLASVPLDQLISFQESTSPSTVNRYNRSRQITLSINLKTGASQQDVQAAVEKEFKSLNLGSQYQGQYSGFSKEMAKTFASFGTALVLSVIFIYLILAAQFESWLNPIVILISLPLSIPFALFSTFITGGSLNLFSCLGILVLFGVVKKNSILQVDHANQLRARGMPRDEAILNASRDRLRPILMTTVAFVAGMLPLAFSSGVGSSTNRSIGDIIIGGQTLSLALTLVAIPVFYSLMDDFEQSFTRLRTRFFPARPNDAEER